MKNILVTGGLGYIGSHTVTSLIRKNFQPIIIDNLSNSRLDVLDKIEKISGIVPKFSEGDIRDEIFLTKILDANKIDGVIHFAGLKDVSESTRNPKKYYDVNVNGTKVLIEQLKKFDGNISSSSGLIGGLLILKAERQVTTEMKESFLIRLEFHHTDWLFIESVTFKNIKENWEKSFEWKSYDVNTDVIGGGRITEKIVIMLSKEELTELLSQSNFDVRLYGKNYYKNFPFPKEKMTTWKQFLNTKMN